MQRIALFSDIHGNLVALDEVLADIDAAGIDERYCLGDLVGYGPEPVGVIERIRSLGIPTIQGNYDEGIGTRRGECGCYYGTDQARSDGAASYAFTEAAVGDADAAWLAVLPAKFRLEIDGVRVLLAHGSPRRINEYLLLDRAEKQLVRLALEADADVVCVGHIHVPYHRSMLAEDRRHVHYISSGSVGKPKDGDPRAGWVEVVIGPRDEVLAAAQDDAAAGPAGDDGDRGAADDTTAWIGAAVHRVAYDVESVAAAMVASGLPDSLAEALRMA